MSEITLPFGKHAGKPLSEVPEGYLGWILSKYRAGEFTSGTIAYFVEDNYDAIVEVYEGVQIAKANADTEEYQLSPSQQESSDGIIEAFERGERFVRLEGGAGYGKSFAVRDVVRNLLRTGHYYIRATAVSYVATQVLAGQLDRYSIPCMTLARLMRLDKSYDGPREVYGPGMETPQALMDAFSRQGDKKSLVIIDEYSMINDDYARMIGEAVNAYDGALLVVGDLKQLPPVKQYSDTILSRIPTAFELRDPMRYSRDSKLYEIEQLVRHNPVNAVATLQDLCDEETVIHHKDQRQLFEAFKHACVNYPHDDNRYIAYRRQDVVDANNEVRRTLFGDNPEPLNAGERLMVVRTSDVPDPASEFGTTRYYTGETLDVAKVDTDDDGFLKVELMNGARFNILFAVNENKADVNLPGGREFNDKLKELRTEALQAEEDGQASPWKEFVAFKNSFVFVAYSYATTVHKSQGATVDRIFASPDTLINIPGVGKNLTYVALTRAKKELHVT